MYLPALHQVDNTDAEGRLLLADALCYSHSFNPSAMIDLATLTGAIDVALGSGAAAVFTNSPPLWDQLHMVHFYLPLSAKSSLEVSRPYSLILFPTFQCSVLS